MKPIATSKFLAKILGFYLLITGLLLIFNMQNMLLNIKDLLSQNSLLFLSGFVTLIISILILVTHFRWHWGWPLIITLLGFWLFIKALLLLLFPQFLGQIFEPFFSSPAYGYGAGLVIIVLASYLIYMGFSKKP